MLGSFQRGNMGSGALPHTAIATPGVAGPPRRGMFGGQAPRRPLTLGMTASPDGAAMLLGGARPADNKGAIRPSPAGPSGLRHAAGILGDALGGMVGQAPLYAQSLQAARQRHWQDERDERDWARRRDMFTMQQDAERNRPQYFDAGNDRIEWNPATGEARVIYDGQSDAQDYAASLGLTPGTPEYRTALQDYVLRHSGPTALDHDLTIEGERQGNRVALEGVRQSNRIQLRGTPTYAQGNPRPAAPRRAAPRRGGGQEVTATGPDGRRVALRNGRWVPIN